MVEAQTKIWAGHVRVNGTSLYYEKYGKGKPLLLLHGWTQTSAFWQPFIAHYAHGFEVYAVDLRGHGKSDPLTDDFSIRNAALDVVQLIGQLNLSEVHAIGFSYGGLVLLELQKSHPHLVQQMVLVGTTNRYNGKESQKGKQAFAYENLDPAFRAYLQSQHAHGETQIKALFNPNLNYQIDLTPAELKRFTSKALIVNGDKDEFAGIAGAVQMHAHIPNASLWIIPQSGHVAIGEANLDAFVKATKAFFASHATTQ